MKKILIADDDDSIRWVLQKTVTAMGFHADLAEDGEKVQAIIPVKEFDDTHYLCFATKKGLIKKAELLEEIKKIKSKTIEKKK